MTCSRNGILSTGTMALGVLQVRGRSLVASPPTRITAFMAVMLAQVRVSSQPKKEFCEGKLSQRHVSRVEALYQFSVGGL